MSLCLLLGGLMWPSSGQAQTFFYNQYQSAQGLPTNEVRAVTQDRLGFLWVATDDGLARFDGQTFRTYQAPLESRYVKAFARRPDGGLLVATDAGVHTVDPERDTASIRRVVPAHPRPTDSTVVYPNGLHYDARGRLWISQPNGSVSRWKGGRLRRFGFDERYTTGTSDSRFFFANDAQGRLWMAASTGLLLRYRPDAERFERVSLPRRPERVHNLQIRGDTLWMAGTGLLGAQVSTEGTLERPRLLSTEGRTVTHLAVDADGLLLGTKNSGLFRADAERDGLEMRAVFGSNDPHRVEDLPFRNIRHLYAVPDGPLWVSSAQGLGLLRSRFFTGVPGLTPNNTLSLYPDDGRVLVSFGDVYEVELRDGRMAATRRLPASEESLITSIASVRDTLWMGTATGQLLASTDGRTVRTFDYSDRGTSIFYLAGDRRGNLWFCQAPEDQPLKGVSKVNADGTMTFYGADRGVENRILALEEGPHAQFYAAGIGPDAYLLRYQPDRDRFINLSLPLPFSPSQRFEAHDLAVDADGVVWLATTDGLLRYNLEQIERVDLGRYTTTEIRSVEVTADGSVWLATDTEGLLHYRNGTVVRFDETAGLPTKVTIYRTLRTDEQGRLWIGTAEGTVHSRRQRPSPKSTPTPLLLSADVNGSPVQTPERLSLRAQSSFALRYTTLAFPGDALTYQYRLTGGHDTTWSDPLSASTIELQRLPIGEYHLELRAKKGSGYRWSAPLRVPVHVRPVWYRTGWAYVLMGLAGTGVLGYLAWYFSRRRRERIEELEDTLTERETLLEEQEQALEQQREAIEEKTEALEATEAHLEALHTFLRELPPGATWTDVFDVLPRLVESVESIEALEFGYHRDDEMWYGGYDADRNERVHRREDFDDRTKVPVWSLFHREPVHIDDFRREHTRYVHSADDVRAPSLLCVPFELPGVQQLVLVAHGPVPHAFDENDRMTAQLLADYLAATVREPLAPSHESSSSDVP